MTAEGEASAEAVFARLQALHPDAHCELNHSSTFQLLVATVLSAQTTDVLVNQVTPGLFARWPTPASLAVAEREAVEQALSRIGMFRQKAKNIVSLAGQLLQRHRGEVPRSLAELIELSGVGRKTANVVLGVAFGAPEGVVVDTHVQRLSQRLGWTTETTPEKIEQALMRLFPRGLWDALSHTLIFHGRRVCSAQRPACAACGVSDVCPSAFNAEHVGRKPPKPRASKSAATTKSATTTKSAKSKRTATTKSAESKRTATTKSTNTAESKRAESKRTATTKSTKTAESKRGESKRAATTKSAESKRAATTKSAKSAESKRAATTKSAESMRAESKRTATTKSATTTKSAKSKRAATTKSAKTAECKRTATTKRTETAKAAKNTQVL